MKHYLFISGPWDRRWMEAPGCPHVTLAERPPLNFSTPLMDGEVKFESVKTHTYTLRSIWLGTSHIEVYAEMGITDNHLLTKLLSVYTGT